MRFFALLFLMIALMAPAAAMACSPPVMVPGGEEPSVQKVVDSILAKNPAFVGKVKVASKRDNENVAGEIGISYDLDVLTQYAGATVRTLKVFSGKDSCGFFVPEGAEVLIHLSPVQGQKTIKINEFSMRFDGLDPAVVEAYLETRQLPNGEK